MTTNTSEHQITNVEEESTDNQVVWAVTDIQRVPKGSVIIDPQVCYNIIIFSFIIMTFAVIF